MASLTYNDVNTIKPMVSNCVSIGLANNTIEAIRLINDLTYLKESVLDLLKQFDFKDARSIYRWKIESFEKNSSDKADIMNRIIDRFISKKIAIDRADAFKKIKLFCMVFLYD